MIFNNFSDASLSSFSINFNPHKSYVIFFPFLKQSIIFLILEEGIIEQYFPILFSKNFPYLTLNPTISPFKFIKHSHPGILAFVVFLKTHFPLSSSFFSSDSFLFLDFLNNFHPFFLLTELFSFLLSASTEVFKKPILSIPILTILFEFLIFFSSPRGKYSKFIESIFNSAKSEYTSKLTSITLYSFPPILTFKSLKPFTLE